MELLNSIVGRMDCIPQTKTAQSATRIAINTSVDKFIAAHKETPRIDLIKAWSKHHFVATNANKEMKRLREYYAMELARFQPKEPYTGAFELKVIFTFPWRKATSKKLIQNSEYAFKITSPDSDNMLKALKDAFERVGILSNDANVARDIVEKRHGPVPGITWRLRPLMEYQPVKGLFPGSEA